MHALLHQTGFYSTCNMCYSVLHSRPELLATPDWELVPLSCGAFGRVFKATCRLTGCRHAVKAIGDADAASREFHMIKLRAAACNSNLATIICTGFSSHADIVSFGTTGAYIIFQELLSIDLFDYIAKPRPAPFANSRRCSLKHIAYAVLFAANGTYAPRSPSNF